MKHLLTVTAVIEAGTGLALVVAPTLVVKLLLGADIFGAAIPLGRVTGFALVALSIACWTSRAAENLSARGLVAAILLYNFGVVVVLGISGIGSQMAGVALWPAVVVHAAMAVWCVALLLRRVRGT